MAWMALHKLQFEKERTTVGLLERIGPLLSEADKQDKALKEAKEALQKAVLDLLQLLGQIYNELQ